MRKVNIRNIRAPAFRPQTASKQMKESFNVSSFATPLYCTWGKVIDSHSEDNTVDVELQTGIEIRRIGVRSLEWAGANSDAYGERDLPPNGCKILILFPDGIIENAFVICSGLDIFGDVGTKQKEELLVSGKETEYLRIKEGGLKTTYEKSTGVYTIEVNDAVISIDASGGIIVTPASGENIELAGNTKNLVTHAELNTALQTFLTALKAAVVSGCGAGSGGTVAGVTLDISGAEAAKVKTS